MRVIDQNTGKPCRLDMTPALKAELEAFRASSCNHKSLRFGSRPA